MWYTFWMTNRWLLLNFDALGALAVLVTMLFSIATLADGAAGLAGLCITSAMAFTTSGMSETCCFYFFDWLILRHQYIGLAGSGQVALSSLDLCSMLNMYIFSFRIGSKVS
jgi:hypothetical protein